MAILLNKIISNAILGFVFVMILAKPAKCQNNYTKICFKVKFKNQEVILNESNHISSQNDSIVFTSLKFYISNFKVILKTESIIESKKKEHLFDMEDTNSYCLTLPYFNINEASKFTFTLGVDSILNTTGANSGDLDPTKGMYWAWHSGYINFKLEGNSPSCVSNRNQFEYHIGGYIAPNITTRKVEINRLKLDKIQHFTNIILIDLSVLIEKINLKKQPTVLSQGKTATEISSWLPSIFSVE